MLVKVRDICSEPFLNRSRTDSTAEMAQFFHTLASGLKGLGIATLRVISLPHHNLAFAGWQII